MYKNYLHDSDKYVYPLTIHEKKKDRTIITYRNNEYGESLRKFHEHYLDIITKAFPSSHLSYAYKSGFRTYDAVIDHIDSILFIKLDIASFFESINYGLFEKKIKAVSPTFDCQDLRYCFYNNHLSLGYVTSPKISDMYLYGFDTQIEKYLSEHKNLRYSRYCDDILLSTKDGTLDDLHEFYSFIETQLSRFDLTVNDKKVREFDLNKDTSASFLGLNIVKKENDNIITVSKKLILETLSHYDKYYEYKKKYDELKKTLKERNYYKRHNKLEFDDPYVIETNELYNKLRKIKNRIIYEGSASESCRNYIMNNSKVSYMRFLKKYKNKFGYDF